VDDCVEAIVRLVDRIPERSDTDPAGSPAAPWRVVNLAGGVTVELEAYIAAIEKALGRKAIRNELPMPSGEPQATLAATDELERLIGFKPATPVETGVRHFVDWYRDFYKL